MAESVVEVEARIRRARRRLGDHLQELQEQVNAATNWRRHMARSPHLWLGAAFVTGFVLSGGTGQGRGRVARALKAQTGTETFDRFVGALSALAVNRGKDYMEARLPGFSRAFDHAGRH